MSRSDAVRRRGTFRALLMLALVAAIVLPVVGLRVLAKDSPEAVSRTGSVTLTPGHRLLYVVDGHVASLSLTGTAISLHGTPVVSDLLCARVYAAHGTGLCLRKINAVAWSATVLDRDLQATTTWPMAGEPALARVSPSGRMVAWTALTRGSSLSGSFSAVTSVVDTSTGTQVEDLAAYTVTKGKHGPRLHGTQVWGVTFVDDDRFYATVSHDGTRYLAVGSIHDRTLRTIAEDVTNPAVSPDGRRVAFVRPGVGERGRGLLAVMNLRTHGTVEFGEQRGVVDQPIWIDARTIGYVVRDDAGRSSIWSTPLGGGTPELLVDDAQSPSPL
ncbi:hypothetical protein [Nocardioides jiangxiensis]|uniref:WD40-like Beta Propeller Repeat n=1 Tax=Nocardioides jiangxiensis TaxID=3064524 RepID=A0ABT9B380_9ACTN|nr:hypothetical protein [Nocardioides sp. WY-20]MDO7867618.1 hypothetical protein [Nocardioides sp. WY-20]